MQRALYLLLVISFFACQEDKQQTSNALDAIPIDAALIIETNDVSKSLKELSRSAPWGLLTTETSIELTPGEHELQLVLGDLYHVAHSPPITSKKIKILVK